MSPEQVYVRQSSGLIKSWSTWDAFIYNAMASGFILNTTIFSQYASMLGAFPGTNPFLGILIAGFGVLPMLIVFAMLASAMPRCGGDYVWMSRILHPAIGFAIILGGVVPFWYLLYMTWNGYNLAVPFLGSALGLIGTLNGWPSLVAAGSWIEGSQMVLVLSIISIIVPALWVSLGMRRYAWIQRGIFVVCLVAFVVIVGGYAMVSNAMFVKSFNQFFSYIGPDTYDKVISTASVSTAFSWSDTLVWTSFVSVQFMWMWMVAPMLGEVKNAESFKHMLAANLGAVFLAVVTQLVLVTLFYLSPGWDFMVSLGKLIFTGDPLITSMPFVPYFNYLPFLAIPNVGLIVVVCIALMLTAFFYNVVNMLGPSRYLFSQSFDRALPEKVAYVNPKFGTPLVAIVICGIIGLLWTFWSTAYPSVWLFVSATGFMAYLPISLVCIVGIIFPYRSSTKHIYEASPCAKYKVKGVPIISILGVLGFVYSIVLVAYYTAIPALGVSSYPPSYYMMVVLLLAAAGLYYVTRWYRKTKQGIDIELAFRDLPPL
jgi:amino acid transporter